MLFVVDWITGLHSLISLPWPHGRQETSSLPLDFWFLHVTCAGEWDIIGCDANKDLKCAYVINFAPLELLPFTTKICFGELLVQEGGRICGADVDLTLTFESQRNTAFISKTHPTIP